MPCRFCRRIRPHLVAERHALYRIRLSVLIHQLLSVCVDKAGIAVLYLAGRSGFLPQQRQIHAVHNAVAVIVCPAGAAVPQQKRL